MRQVLDEPRILRDIRTLYTRFVYLRLPAVLCAALLLLFFSVHDLRRIKTRQCESIGMQCRYGTELWDRPGPSVSTTGRSSWPHFGLMNDSECVQPVIDGVYCRLYSYSGVRAMLEYRADWGGGSVVHC